VATLLLSSKELIVRSKLSMVAEDDISG